MRCPKCQYITFDQGDRCRNCGYDFALSPEPDALDLPIRTGDEKSEPGNRIVVVFGGTGPAAPERISLR